MREIILQTDQLTKSYGKFTALDHADITVYRGDIYGLIGRNGAGKTTIIKLLQGLPNQLREAILYLERAVMQQKRKKDVLAL